MTIIRLGVSLPPQVHGPLQGELQLYMPYVNLRRGKGRWNQPPQSVEESVGVLMMMMMMMMMIMMNEDDVYDDVDDDR